MLRNETCVHHSIIDLRYAALRTINGGKLNGAQLTSIEEKPLG
jgi:hypothetical protein